MSPLSRRAGLAASLFASTLLLGSPAQASFELPFQTGRAAALGGASLAEERDSAALFVNPALTAGLKSPEAYFSYDQMFAGLNVAGTLNNGFLAAAAPTKLGSFSAGVGLFNGAGLLAERTAAVGWARELWEGVRFGVAGKQLYHNYMPGGDPVAAADPVFKNGTSRGAFAVDAGVAVDVNERVRLGLAARNLNAPDVGLSTVDRVPRVFQGGVAARVLGVRALGDVTYSNDGNGYVKTTPSVGLEKGLVDGRVDFRVGASPDAFTGGVGFRFGRMAFDYALVLSRSMLLRDNAGTHTIGLRVQFGDNR